jgi:hypothetical protein
MKNKKIKGWNSKRKQVKKLSKKNNQKNEDQIW